MLFCDPARDLNPCAPVPRDPETVRRARVQCARALRQVRGRGFRGCGRIAYQRASVLLPWDASGALAREAFRLASIAWVDSEGRPSPTSAGRFLRKV